MYKKLTITFLKVCLLVIFTASADDDPLTAQEDTFSESYLTFDQIDLNNDGRLDVNELRMYGDAEDGVEPRSHQHGENVLEKLDENGDQFVNRKEFQEGGEEVETDDNWW